MNANELRLNNFIFDDNGDTTKVFSLSGYGCPEINDDQVSNRYKPIPLTEEWLVKFGFEKDIETKSWSILTSLEKFDYLFEISNKYQHYFQPDFARIDIKYVHQLQNLYFALTGEELTLKEL